MLIGDSSGAVAAGSSAIPAGDLIKESGAATFMHDVIEGSKYTPVIVDYWAPWCGPCKQLTPTLEKLVKQYAGKVKLVKVNVDDNQQLAAQFRVQSIPAVYAFKGGRPVDGFMGAMPESQVKTFIEKLTGGGGNPIDEALAEAEAFIAEGQPETALEIYQEILAQDPAHVKAMAGALKTYIALGQDETAIDLLSKLPDDLKKAAEIAAVQTALDLKAQAAGAGGEVDALAAKVAANPKDLQARQDLAMARFGAGDKEGAMNELLESIRIDRKWNEEAARKQLVKFFEAFGPADALTVQGRRKLSSILFS
ncbi:MAG: thioredoxin [Rhodospirillaceae bacterium]|nr:thioredoxin [Rhodospirillaceae bacterium]